MNGQISGTGVPLWRADVDTDQIIPKQFLKRIERSGYGEFLFFDWRRNDPDFVLDRPRHRGATILVAGPNFGCGSSREHAVWAIQQAGFAAVLAPSFADIFLSNCRQAGLAAVPLPEEELRRLCDLLEREPGTEITIDLEAQVAAWPGAEVEFELDSFTRECLLQGWDSVGLVLRHADAIAAYERGRSELLPAASS